MPGDVGRYAALLERIENAVFLGQELLRNAGWAGGGAWTVTGTWGTPANGVCAVTLGTGSLSQSVTSGAIRIGAKYRVSYMLTNVTAGDIRFQFTGGTNDDGLSRSAAGVYSEDIVITQTIATYRFINAGTAFSGTISGISLREVLSI